jgi:hypothetical protein
MRGLWARVRGQRDVWVCLALVTVVSCVVLWRLGLLAPNQQDVLVVDNARTAEVARNIALGHGYTADDLPTSLVAFYDQEGKLHDDRWVNADRFPFTAYAIAALYLVTGQRDAWTGVIGYNLITFVLFLVALYVFVRRVTESKVGGGIAVTLALLHGHTYFFLFMKDADMMLLAVLALSCFHRYFGTRLEDRSAGHMIWFGTVLGWSFLARPNVGAPFMAVLLAVSLVGLVQAVRRLGAGAALRRWAMTDAIAGAVAALWLLPFLIHTMAEWGSPFFSANGLYQPMLGTRFGMGTDTWWRYVPGGYDYSRGHLWTDARSDMIAKLTTSWLATLRTFVSAYFVEIALALGAIQVARTEASRRSPGLRGTVLVVLVVFAFNFAVLPLYSYRDYSWRHYLAFVLPVVWLAAAITLLHVGRWMTPAWDQAQGWARRHVRAIVAVGAVIVVVVAVRTPGGDGNYAVMAIVRFWESRWLLATATLGAILGIGRMRRWSGTTWGLAALTVAVIVLYRPHTGHKNFTHIHVPASTRVFTELGRRNGIVVSFAHQTQVSWNTGRKNIPAPEFVLNLYALARAHRLELEDLYIESPAAMLNPYDGLFGRAAPGFEGYLRLATYRDHLPGYRLAFHAETTVGISRFKIAPRPKSSTVYTIADRGEIDGLFRTPDTIAIGTPASVVHTAHGFGGYYAIDGKDTVAATDATRKRYTPKTDRPWEDTSITLFVDDRTPTQVTVEFYAVADNSVELYWNLDLDEYTPAGARGAHSLGKLAITEPGWNRATFDVPAGLVRRGLNKLGFRAERFTRVALCDAGTTEALCAELRGDRADQPAATLMRAPTEEPDQVVNLSMFLHRVDFAVAPR